MKWLLLVLPLLLASCSSLNKTGSVDPSQRTITVPPGSAMFPIKTALTRDGWTVKVKNVTNYRAGAAYDTRYAMEAAIEFYDYMFPSFRKLYHYDISIQDTKTNEEILTMGGTDTSEDIGAKLVKALR
jgi:hypothetical protein